jgi:hypothetical protein
MEPHAFRTYNPTKRRSYRRLSRAPEAVEMQQGLCLDPFLKHACQKPREFHVNSHLAANSRRWAVDPYAENVLYERRILVPRKSAALVVADQVEIGHVAFPALGKQQAALTIYVHTRASIAAKAQVMTFM